MSQYAFYMPTKILFGPNQLKNLHKEKLPGEKALIVISNGKSTKKYGYLSQLETELQKTQTNYSVFDRIRPNPTRENVMQGAKQAHEQNCDFVIALGGGSVMDAAKCIALMMTNPGDLWDYSLSETGKKKTASHNAAPLVAITTSAGTGSEADMGGVISDDLNREKTAIFFPSMFPVLSIVDSQLMETVPPEYTAYQGMDAFFHASESMINKSEHPMGEMFALKAIELISQNITVAYNDGSNSEARENMALANTLAAFYMLCTSPHAMEHAMGSYHESLPHGADLMMIAHAYYDFLAEHRASENSMIKMAKAMGVENPTSGKDFVKALDQLMLSIGGNEIKMSTFGIKKEELIKFPKRMHGIVGGDTSADPIQLSDDDYLLLFEKSYR